MYETQIYKYAKLDSYSKLKFESLILRQIKSF
jgi:hypothetical protein